jgi:hypothetical protein
MMMWIAQTHLVKLALWAQLGWRQARWKPWLPLQSLPHGQLVPQAH